MVTTEQARLLAKQLLELAQDAERENLEARDRLTLMRYVDPGTNRSVWVVVDE